MRKWVVYDRESREIYLTEEQWEHIISRHGELRNHLEDVLNTIRLGKRKQQSQDPQAYVYHWQCETLRYPFNGIIVAVVFRFEPSNGHDRSNNFIVTAWGAMRREG